VTSDPMEEIQVDGFKTPVPKSVFLGVHRWWGEGDSRGFIAEIFCISAKKVTAIVSTKIPDCWVKDYNALR